MHLKCVTAHIKITCHFHSIALIPKVEGLLGIQKLQYKDPQEQLTMVIM